MSQNRYRSSVSQLRPDASHYRREAHINKLESEAHLIRYAKAQMTLRDYWLSALKETEYRVVEFVLRQTLGFNKDEDVISIGQFTHGVGDRCGVGVSRSNIIAALDALGGIGLLLESHRYYADSKGRKPSSFRVNLDMLFDTRPSRDLMERKAGEGKRQRQGPGPASEIRSPGPASKTTLVLPTRPDTQGPGPASRTHIQKTINTSHTTARCPHCQTATWRRAENGEVLCGLCNCEQFGHPELRPQVDEILKKRRLLR